MFSLIRQNALVLIPSPPFATCVAQANLPLEQRLLVLGEICFKTLNVVVVFVREVLSVLHLKSASPHRHKLAFENLHWIRLCRWLRQSKGFILSGTVMLVRLPSSEIQFESQVTGSVVVRTASVLNQMVHFRSIADVREVYIRKSGCASSRKHPPAVVVCNCVLVASADKKSASIFQQTLFELRTGFLGAFELLFSPLLHVILVERRLALSVRYTWTACEGLVIGSQTCGENSLGLDLVDVIFESHCFVVALY